MLLPSKSSGVILRMFLLKGEKEVGGIVVQLLLQSEATRVEWARGIQLGLHLWAEKPGAGGLPQPDPAEAACGTHDNYQEPE